MATNFDHAQYAVDVRLILGESTSEITKSAPMTDEEYYRCAIDAGFNGNVSFVEADLYFERYSSAIQNVTWKWQIKSKGQSAWTDLHNAVTESWGGYASSRKRIGIAASGLGVNATVPFELRLVATASTAATVNVRIGTCTPSIRVMGETA